MYGPRGCGLTTLIGFVASASKHPCLIAPTTFVQELLPEKPRNIEVVFVELLNEEDAVAAVMNGHVDSTNDGCFVKVLPNGWSVDDPTWAARERAFDTVIGTHTVPCAGAMNQYKDPLHACIALARAARLKS